MAQTYGTNQWWTSRNSFIWSQLGTQRSEGRKLPTTQTMESHSYPSKFRPKPSSLGTHMAHTHTQGRHSYPRGLVIASPTRRPEHNDSHYYGHSSRTFCNSLSQDTNFFPQKHNLMKSYNHIFIFKQIQFHNLYKNIIKTSHNSTQNTFTSFPYFITQSEFLRSSTMAFSYLMYGLNTQIIHNYTKQGTLTHKFITHNIHIQSSPNFV